jgi:hypothetical protein
MLGSCDIDGLSRYGECFSCSLYGPVMPNDEERLKEVTKMSTFDNYEKDQLLDAIDEFLETGTVGDLLKVVAYAVASQEGD